MNILERIKESKFPEGRIVLLNGTELVGYNKVSQCNTNGTGTTCTESLTKEEKNRDKDLFVKHAFLFYRNAHRIMSDSRMFLARVPIINGLAYSGTAGFETPTLGVYIEWWIHGKGTITSDGKGHEALTFHFGGSPLSSNNICSCVYPDLHTATITHYPFRPVWKNFVEINRRYTMAKQQYEAYTLQEVIDILLAAEAQEVNADTARLHHIEMRYERLKNQYADLTKAHEALTQMYRDVCIQLHYAELVELKNDIKQLEESSERELDDIKVNRSVLKQALKRGELTLQEYLCFVTPLSKRRKEIEHKLATFRPSRVKEFCLYDDITCEMVEDFLDSDDTPIPAI